MTELPEQFDSKRELDAWLCEYVRGEEMCHKTLYECGGCDKMVYKGLTEDVEAHGVDTDGMEDSEVVRHYTNKRNAALDLLEEFCEEHDLDFKVYPQQVEIKRTAGFVGLWTIKEEYDQDYTIDPLAVSVAIYRAFKKIEEENRDS